MAGQVDRSPLGEVVYSSELVWNDPLDLLATASFYCCTYLEASCSFSLRDMEIFSRWFDFNSTTSLVCWTLCVYAGQCQGNTFAKQGVTSCSPWPTLVFMSKRLWVVPPRPYSTAMFADQYFGCCEGKRITIYDNLPSTPNQFQMWGRSPQTPLPWLLHIFQVPSIVKKVLSSSAYSSSSLLPAKDMACIPVA